MGYHTYHKLYVYTENKDGSLKDCPNEETSKHEILITRMVFKNTYDEEPGNADDKSLFEDGWGWYDHENNMKKHSQEYPDLVFCIHGEGNETGDLWDAYFKNGQIQNCPATIDYPPYDRTKLK